MAFCTSCGAENPEEARFCAKCGHKMLVEPALPPPAAQTKPDAPAARPTPPAEPEPITLKPKEPSKAPAAAEVLTGIDERPAPPKKPVQETPVAAPAKEALKAPRTQAPKGSPKEPIPGAPGQTQFFMAAAQVSTGAKAKRVIIFIVGAIIVGTLLFLMIRFAMQKQEAARGALTAEPAEAAAPAPTPAVVESEDAGTDGAPAGAADAGKEEAKVEEKKPVEEVKKPAAAKEKKKVKRKKRTR